MNTQSSGRWADFKSFTKIIFLLSAMTFVSGFGSLSLGADRVVPEITLEHIVFGSCLGQWKESPALEQAAESGAQAFIFLGDNIYADTEDMQKMESMYQQFNARPDVQKLRSQMRVEAIWDDHDYGQDNAGREYPQKAKSKELFLNAFAEPQESPRWTREGNYASVLYGSDERQVLLVLLDTRWFRSPLKTSWFYRLLPHTGPYRPNRSKRTQLLGPKQWEWLEEQMNTPARVIIIASSIQVLAQHHGYEAWDNFPRERRRLIRLIESHPHKQIVLVSGDIHWGEVSKIRLSGGRDLYDITSSALNQTWHRPGPNRHRIGKIVADSNYGEIKIDWNRSMSRRPNFKAKLFGVPE